MIGPSGSRAVSTALLLLAACTGTPGPIEQVTIPAGSSFGVITDSLAAHHVIEHPKWFRLLARVRGLDRSVRAGVYQLARGSSAWAVMDALKRGDQLMLRITVPEGLTLAEIAPIANAELGIPVDSFMAAANDPAGASAFVPGAMTFEGLLLPETYLVPAGVTARGLVRIMAQQGLEAWDPGWAPRLDSLGMTRLHLLALASIIEGEARVNSERSVISAVYWNRIRKGMPLQADPTVQYAIQLATGIAQAATAHQGLRLQVPLQHLPQYRTAAGAGQFTGSGEHRGGPVSGAGALPVLRGCGRWASCVHPDIR